MQGAGIGRCRAVANPNNDVIIHVDPLVNRAPGEGATVPQDLVVLQSPALSPNPLMGDLGDIHCIQVAHVPHG